MSEFFQSVYFKWLLVDFFSFFLVVYLIAFVFSNISSSDRLERVVLKGYLTGILIHIIVTLTFGLLVFKRLYELEETWNKIWLFDAGFILMLVFELIFAFIIWSKINKLPKLL